MPTPDNTPESVLVPQISGIIRSYVALSLDLTVPEIPDIVIRVYLYVLIIGNVVLPVMWLMAWIFQRRRPRHPLIKLKLLLRDALFLISGLIGWHLFSTRVLSNAMVLVATFVMLVISTYATELTARLCSKRSSKGGAT